MLNDFKEFIARGNVLDLAIGLVIGAAFGKIITTMVEGLLMPIVGMMTGGVDFASKCYPLTDKPFTSCAEAKAQGVAVLQYGQFIADIGLEVSGENELGFDKNYPYYVQDLTYNKFDNEKPFFVLPVSSVTRKNVKSITFALYKLLEQGK